MRSQITNQAVISARQRIGRFIDRTPLVRSQFLSDFVAADVYMKLENQQRLTNSFKIRGALNKLLDLKEQGRVGSIVTASAGNHGQAVAIVSEMLGIHAIVVVPRTTPSVKVNKIQSHNVELVLYGNSYDEAEQKAIRLAAERNIEYISPYDDEFVIAGQGTIGLEILEDLPDVGRALIPVGGGGLISGVGLAIKTRKPSTLINGVQSFASPVMYESLKAGRIIDAVVKDSIADGLAGGIVRESRTFGLAQQYVDSIILVDETSIRRAIYLLWTKEKQRVEGAGAVTVAALLERKEEFGGQKVVALISGGNIDDPLLQEILLEGSSEVKLGKS